MSSEKRNLQQEKDNLLSKAKEGEQNQGSELGNAKGEQIVKKTNYFILNKWENIFSISACCVMIYWMISFSFTTQELHKKTPILGVRKDSFGFQWDNSDIQWRHFIGNMDIMLPGSIIFILVSKALQQIFKDPKTNQLTRKIFIILSGGGFYIYLLRGGALFWLFFSTVNYIIISLFSSKKFFPFLLWGFNILLIFTNDKYKGYNLVTFFHCDALQFIQNTKRDAIVEWHIIYNMAMLRIISFGMDKYWAHLKYRQTPKDKHEKKCDECSKTVECLRERQEQFHSLHEYNAQNYFSYLLYAPVLITGPPLIFNAFLSQIKKPQQTHGLKEKLKYTLRTIIVFATFLIWNRINFGFAMVTKSHNEHIWRLLDQKDLFCAPFNALVFLWMKFSCLWKYSRCWAIWDDMEVPENMNRCIFNNYCFEGFWRSWHRGFNQWLIRYIYLPCGGSRTKAWNIWIIFTFVAIWHDLNINLLLWAWGVCLCLVPEIGVKAFIQLPRFNRYTQTHYWKYVCGFFAALQIVWLVFTNLTGFGIGYQTLIVFIQKSISSWQGFGTLVICLFDLGLISLKQMELRETENKNF